MYWSLECSIFALTVLILYLTRSFYFQAFPNIKMSSVITNFVTDESLPILSTEHLNETGSTMFPDTDSGSDIQRDILYFFQAVVSPAFCAFGVVGNILNVVVLTRRRSQVAVDNRMERTACSGLSALAVSDMMFCLASFFKAFSTEQILYENNGFWMYYQLYGGYVRNVFSYTSTWLTVIMALNRYVVICHPLHARIFLNPGCTKLVIFLALVFWSLLVLPEIWTYSVVVIEQEGADPLYFIDSGILSSNKALRTSFTYTWMLLGFLIPIVILAFCNIQLIQALRESQRMRKEYRVSNGVQKSGSRITPTLIALVAMFIVLVSPSEIINIVFYAIGNETGYDLDLFVQLTNLMHTANFSVHFVLYCIVNVHFRNVLKDMFCFCRRRKRDNQFDRSRNTSYSHLAGKSSMVVSSHVETAVWQ